RLGVERRRGDFSHGLYCCEQSEASYVPPPPFKSYHTSGLAPRSAARAALGLKGAEDPKPSAPRAALDLKGAEDPKASASRLKTQSVRPQKNIAQPPCNPLVTPQ
ncbi:hypothetical protein ABEH27_21125, partial [Pseudomonas sp. P39-UII1]|uniref:hypothetical protein n=1 Tax=Pseudomonas sp. P39-UII1 TaxID=3080333 RepID=UPI00320AC035